MAGGRQRPANCPCRSRPPAAAACIPLSPATWAPHPSPSRGKSAAPPRNPPAASPRAVPPRPAVVSLHHVEPLAESLAVLADVVKRGGTLVLDELDVDRIDEAAVAWRLANANDDHSHYEEPAQVVAAMRHHLHSLATLREALDE